MNGKSALLIMFWIIVKVPSIQTKFEKLLLGKLISEITNEYFVDYRCIVFITESTQEILGNIPQNIEIFNIKIGQDSTVGEIEEIDTFDSNAVSNGTKSFEQLLIASLNSVCQGYFVQVNNPKSIVYSLARATRKSFKRIGRRYVFLPVTSPINISDIFSMKEMIFMPDLIIIRVLDDCKLHDLEIRGRFETLIDKTSSLSSRPRSSGQKFALNPEMERDYFPNLNRNYDNSDGNKIISFINYTGQDVSEARSHCLEILTHRFAGNEKASDPILLDVWLSIRSTYRFLYGNDLFPDKIRNLQGKKLRLMSFAWAHFIVVDMEAKPPIQDGMEILMIGEFARRFNATWELKLDEENLWGTIFDNGSGVGLLGEVAMDRADFAMAALYTWQSTYRWLDFTVTYCRCAVICMAPKPKMLPKWLSPFLPFNPLVWSVLGASLITVSLTFYTLAKVSQHSFTGTGSVRRYITIVNSTFETIGLYLEQSSEDATDSNDASQGVFRNLVACILAFSVLLNTAYNSGLASILTVPQFEQPIETRQQFADANIKWAGNHMSWIWSIMKTGDPLIETIVSNFRVLESNEITALASKGTLSFPMEQTPAGFFAISLNLTHEVINSLRIMKEPLYWSPIVMLVRKNSAYLDHYNVLVRRLFESGILLYWEGAIIRKHFSMTVQTAIAMSKELVTDEGPINLTVEHIQGAYLILAVGLGLSTIVFSIEIAVHRYKNIPPKKAKTLIIST